MPHRPIVVAREAQLAGAFYKTAERLSVVLLHYVTQALPSVDPREPGLWDRRSNPRGGRRITDVALLPPT
jgi:hypothetical protein